MITFDNKITLNDYRHLNLGLKCFKFIYHKENRFLIYGPTRGLVSKILNS